MAVCQFKLVFYCNKNICYSKTVTQMRLTSLTSLQVNAADHLGQTALHRAARCGHLQTCRLLLSAGCDPLLTSLQGFSPSQLGNESVQEILQGVLLMGLYLCQLKQLDSLLPSQIFIIDRTVVSQMLSLDMTL